jgi:hypothetical protein
MLELKLARNGKFWNNAPKQLSAYLIAERAENCFFIVITFSDSDARRIRRIRATGTLAAKAAKCEIRTIVVNASADKPSASKL